MSDKLTQFDRISSFNGMLKLGKETYFYVVIVAIHLLIISGIGMFVSLFMSVDFFLDYIKAFFSFNKDVLMFSKAVGYELLRKDILDIFLIKALKEAGYFLCATGILYTVMFIPVNNQIKKFIKMINKDGSNKILSGAVILKDNEFMNKYISLRKNDKEGIFISQVFELQEVDKNGNPIKN